MDGNDAGSRETVSRRQLLQGLGLGAAGSMLLGSGAAAVLEASAGSALAAATSAIEESDSAHFGRMFANLPFFGQNLPGMALQDALLDIGRPGGILDAADQVTYAGDTEATAKDLITVAGINGNPTATNAYGTNPDNPTMTAGAHFVGQFIDHDLTFDISSQLGVTANPTTSPNGRTPAFDLDSVYGGGPTVSPHLYDSRGVKFLIESGGVYEDLPRNSNLTAIIPEPRNDENLIISGLHCAFLKFHNASVDWVNAHDQDKDPAKVFAQVRRLTTWHYQWIVVNEILPHFAGQAMVNDVLTNGRKFYRPIKNVPFMPVEFQAAAYRMGHSMVRPSYRANFTGDGITPIMPGTPFFAFIFDPTSGSDSSDPIDLSGGHRAPRRFVGWHTFFDFSDGNVKQNKKIDTKISTPLFHLPIQAIPGSQLTITALPQRTLLRHITWSLPSGQVIAGATGAPILSSADLSELQTYGLGLEANTPLWYYILREAEVIDNGQNLGPVGGRIVSEVFIGLLQLDHNSYIDQGWRPTLPQASGKVTGQFTMVDFLTFAGVGAQR